MKFEDLKVGMKDQTQKTITDAYVWRLSGVSTDTNPLHISEEAAKKGIFKSRVAHGMLVASLISAVLGTKLPGEGTIYLGQELKFKRPVYLGNTITAICEITDLIPEKSLVILNTTCVNQDGVEVITGKATVMVK